MTVKFLQPAVFALAMAASFSALAQAAYRCSSGGAAYFSDRPCPTASTPPIVAYGPTRSAAAMPYSQQQPAAPKAQDHVKYLGSGCASISEAIRTGPTRGVRGNVIRDLHEEYRQKCSLEDQDARRQLSEENSKQRQTVLAQRQEVADSRQQAKKKNEQCAGMRDVVVLKRKRESELNAKEVAALRELEKSYNERCTGG